jgi:hypothetical protein
MDAFRAFSRMGERILFGASAFCDLIHLLVPHVLQDVAQLQPSAPQHQQLATPEGGGPVATKAGAASRDINWWWAAVGALTAVWPRHCDLLDPETALEVLQRVLQGVVALQQQQQQLQQLLVDKHILHMAQQSLHAARQLAGMLLVGVRPHITLVTAVLQHSTIMPLMVAAVNTEYRCTLNQMVQQLLKASPLPLREVPAAHEAVCKALASGSTAGAELMSVFTMPAQQATLGLWQDPALQAACLEGARKAAAAVAAAVVSQGGEGAASGSSSTGGQQQVVAASQAPMQEGHGSTGADQLAPAASSAGTDTAPARVTSAPLSTEQGGSTALPGPDAWEVSMDQAYSYAWGMLCILDGQQSAQPAQCCVAGEDLLATAWQCLLGVLQWCEKNGTKSDRPGLVANRLLSSAAARQVLFHQAGGLCSLEEVCGMLVRCFEVDSCGGAVTAVGGLLEEPGVWDAAMALPGFAGTVVKHAFGRADITDQRLRYNAPDRARLLEGLMSHEPGRAALLAQPDVLGQISWEAATGPGTHVLLTQVAQLWAAGKGEGLAGAMVAGLAAGQEGCVKLCSWLIKFRPSQEWRQLPGLLPALAAAFNADQVDKQSPRRYDVRTSPLATVLVSLLEKEQGHHLLSSSQELTEALGLWLQRTASPEHVSPIHELLHGSSEDAAGAMCYLASSPLSKGALVSLVTCRNGGFNYNSWVGDWLEQVSQLQQLVLGDRGLLCALLRALAASCSTQDDDVYQRNTSARYVFLRLPEEELLPQLVELLVGVEDSNGCNLPAAAAAASSPDTLLVHGAWLAMHQVQERSTAGKQLVVEAAQQLATDAGRVREMQQMEAAGHATWVAAAQARQEAVAQQQQLQQEREAIELKQQQLQQEREALQAERQLLEQLRGEAGQGRKRRQLG